MTQESKSSLSSLLLSQLNEVEMFSFHSISKGFVGECGHRGGYMEATGISPDVLSQIYKVVSVSLCPNTIGQLLVSLVCRPPSPETTPFSWPIYRDERDKIYDSLKRRASLVVSTLNSLSGIKCQPAEGAMYAFPSIDLPPRACSAAKDAGKLPDVFYCLQLLSKTGIVVVPGSGFGQKQGTWHFRTTFLPPEEMLSDVLKSFTKFHNEFMEQYK